MKIFDCNQHGIEVIHMMDTFSKMGVKPKANTPEQLMKWMSDFMQAQKTMKEDSDKKLAFPPPPKTDVSSVSSCSLLRAAIFHKWHHQILDLYQKTM
jgi:hypothetical protein